MVFRECLGFIKSLGSHCFQDYTRFKAPCAAAILPRAGNTHRARSMQGLVNKACQKMACFLLVFHDYHYCYFHYHYYFYTIANIIITIIRKNVLTP